MTLDELRELARAKLRAAGLAGDHADAVAETMVAGERDGCASHGIYRLLVADRSIRAGVVVPDAVPQVSEPKAGLVRVDGGGGFAQLAFQRGMPLLVEKARANGIAALALNNVVHFAALWPEVEALAARIGVRSPLGRGPAVERQRRGDPVRAAAARARAGADAARDRGAPARRRRADCDVRQPRHRGCGEGSELFAGVMPLAAARPSPRRLASSVSVLCSAFSAVRK